ncbi:g5557 [Coccomyxa viridis]|uniref:G5557 protein n=1 Tax=Coccomyxa viridis TaxID=1274662 RepID=A0ABP1FT59_9CHLO
MQHEPLQAKADYTPPSEHHAHSADSSPEKDAVTTNSSGEEEQDEDDLCIVCWEKLREVIFYHCMHMCTCQGCAGDVMAAGALCRMCCASIRSTITARF